jgi:SagB-type dehydrogenase family enzyme
MLELPTHPKLNPVISLHIADSGIIVDGLPNFEVLRGMGAETVIPVLMPHLGGALTTDEIIEKLPGIPERYVYEVLTLMADWGLLETGPTRSERLSPSEIFLARHQLSLGTGFVFDETLSQLRLTQVLLETRSSVLNDFPDALTPLLQRSFITQILCRELTDSEKTPAVIARVVIDSSACCSDASAAESSRRITTLLLLQTQTTLLICSVGCLQSDGLSCCEIYFRDLLQFLPQKRESNHSQYIASILAGEIVDIVIGAPRALRGRLAREYNLGDVTSIFRPYPRSPFCKGCAPSFSPQGIWSIASIAGQSSRLNIAWHYNEHLHREPVTRTTGQAQTSPSRRKIRQTSLDRFVGVSIPLPTSGASFSTNNLPSLAIANCKSPCSRISLNQIAALCSLSAGIRENNGSVIKRWAPSAGNLGATRIHILVAKGADLETGVYTYDPAAHTLYLRAKHQSIPISEVFASLFRHNGLRDASALAVYSVRRDILRPKYGSFSYKLSFLDGGCALAQGRCVSTAMQLPTSVIESWPDTLVSEMVGLRPGDEQVAAILAIGPTKSFFRTRMSEWYVSGSGIHGSSSLRAMTSKEIADTLADEAETSDKVMRSINVSRQHSSPVLSKLLIDVPSPSRTVVNMEEVLSRRSSTRSFAGSPLTASELGALLLAGTLADRSGSDKGSAVGLELEFYIVCANVDGISAGVYRYLSRRRKLEFVAPLPPESEVAELFTQRECTTAAVTVLITGDIAQATQSLGAFGYRHLLVRAGAAGQMIAIAALAQGLSSVVLAGIAAEHAYRILKLQDVAQSTLFACAIGRGSQEDVLEWEQ